MTVYVDTSVLVAALTKEQRTTAAQKWLSDHEAGMLSISPWTITEFASALAIKVRTAALTLDQYAQVQTQWRQMQNHNLLTMPVTAGAFAKAAIFIADTESGLRSGDALHLAIASDHGLQLATLDIVLAKAAPRFGVSIAKGLLGN